MGFLDVLFFLALGVLLGRAVVKAYFEPDRKGERDHEV